MEHVHIMQKTKDIFTKDVAAGSAAVEEHFALIDQRLETRTQNRAES